jgi:ZIP family zinc transporter
MIIFYGKPSPKKLGYLTSFSAGVMVYISFMDLLPEAVAVVGFAEANAAVRICLMVTAPNHHTAS